MVPQASAWDPAAPCIHLQPGKKPRGNGEISFRAGAVHDWQGPAEGSGGLSGRVRKGESSTVGRSCPQVNTERLTPFLQVSSGSGRLQGKEDVGKTPKNFEHQLFLPLPSD